MKVPLGIETRMVQREAMIPQLLERTYTFRPVS